MWSTLTRSAAFFRPWRRFCILLVLIFLARAGLVLSVLPPFEGWDEYQHLSYVVQLLETAEDAPSSDEGLVPRSLYPALLRYPHSTLGAEQLESLGVLDYERFRRGDAPPSLRADAADVVLYQRQHPTLYYRLAAPVYDLLSRGSSRPEDVLRGLTGLRVLNALLGAAALAVALAALGRLMRETPVRHLVGLLITLQPLFLLNCCRVANDALAVLLGTVAVAGALLLLWRAWPWAIGVGLVIGLGVLAKANILALAPFVALLLLAWAIMGRITWRAAAIRGLLCLGAFVAVTGFHFHHHLTTRGVLTPMQEAVANRAAGRTFTDAAAAAREIDWFSGFLQRQLRHTLWVGGWSMLRPPALLNGIHQAAAYHALAGVLFVWPSARRRERMLFDDAGTTAGLILLPLCVMAGLAYHAIHTQMAYGSVLTNSWYAAVASPWTLALCVQSLSFLPGRRAATVFAMLTTAVFLACEAYGTLVLMPRAYVGEGWGATAAARLAELHPAWLGPWLTLPAQAVVLLLVVLAVGVWRSPPGPVNAVRS